MSKKNNISYLSLNHKLIFSYNIYILIFISKISFSNNEIINYPYPVTLQLYDGNLFIANKKGMYLYNKNLDQIAIKNIKKK